MAISKKRQADNSEPATGRATKRRAVMTPTTTRMTRSAYKKLKDSDRNTMTAQLHPGLPMETSSRLKKSAPAPTLSTKAPADTAAVTTTAVEVLSTNNTEAHQILMTEARSVVSDSQRETDMPMTRDEASVRGDALVVHEMAAANPGGPAPVAFMGGLEIVDEPCRARNVSCGIASTIGADALQMPVSGLAHLAVDDAGAPPQPESSSENLKDVFPQRLRTCSLASSRRWSAISPRTVYPRRHRSPIQPCAAPNHPAEAWKETGLYYPECPTPSNVFDPSWCFPKTETDPATKAALAATAKKVLTAQEEEEHHECMPAVVMARYSVPPEDATKSPVSMIPCPSSCSWRPRSMVSSTLAEDTPGVLTPCGAEDEFAVEDRMVDMMIGEEPFLVDRGLPESKTLELVTEAVDEWLKSPTAEAVQKMTLASGSGGCAEGEELSTPRLGANEMVWDAVTGEWQRQNMHTEDLARPVKLASPQEHLMTFPRWPYSDQLSHLPLEDDQYSEETYSEDNVIF